MTPQQIATQAAEAIESCIQTSFGEFEDFDRVEAAKIILTAAAKMIQHSGAVQALEPFAKFSQCYQAKPMSGIDDEFYGIHTGTPYEASIRHTDMKRAAAALERLRSISEGEATP